MKRAIKGYPGLYREDCGKEGKRFRILIHFNKQITQEYFYFGISVSETKAKRAAIQRWRELRSIYPVITKRRFREIPRNVSDSGIPGVTRITSTSKGHEYESWKAVWTTTRGAKLSRQFSVLKYGDKVAKKLAIEARNAALDEVGSE